METINSFQYDRWIDKPISDLEVGDIISDGGNVATVAALPYEEDGKTRIPGAPYDSGPIKFFLGEYAAGKENIIEVMDLVNSDLAEFDDGTALITDFEAGNSLVYSPRLPIAELEAFCAKHIERYQAFYKANMASLDECETIPMTPWW